MTAEQCDGATLCGSTGNDRFGVEDGSAVGGGGNDNFEVTITDETTTIDASGGSGNDVFMLRISERTDRIHHIPQILYHWRAIPGSIAAGAEQKSGVEELQAAVEAIEGRDGVRFYVEHTSPFKPTRLIRTPGFRRVEPVSVGNASADDRARATRACSRRDQDPPTRAWP